MSSRATLGGLRIVEAASGVAGPMAASRLADLGADVVKVEWGSGDWMRGCPPFVTEGIGAAYFALNRGKRSLCLGETGEGESDLLRALVARADVFITDQTTQTLSALGLAGVAAETCEWNPRLIVAQISALGKHGPLADKPASELCAQAMAGYTRYLGASGRPAVRLGADVAGCTTAIFTVQAVLAALLSRRRSGRGQRIDLSLLNSLLSMKTVHLAAQSDPDSFTGPRVGGAYDPPERGWATADKPITFAFGGAVGAEGRPGWIPFVTAMGLSRMLDDPRFDKHGRMTTGMGAKARELKSEYEAEFGKRSAAEVVAKARGFGGFASAYLTHEELLREPQVRALDIVTAVACGTRTVPTLNFPVKFSASKPVIRGDAPRLGEHTREIAAELGLAATDTARA
jgi:crotonobetainyl-CoA:carnitine CoA-transferase CaiB-like acyl-CoA transferase